MIDFIMLICSKHKHFAIVLTTCVIELKCYNVRWMKIDFNGQLQLSLIKKAHQMTKVQEGCGSWKSILTDVDLAEIPSAFLQFPSRSCRPQEEEPTVVLIQAEGHAELFRTQSNRNLKSSHPRCDENPEMRRFWCGGLQSQTWKQVEEKSHYFWVSMYLCISCVMRSTYSNVKCEILQCWPVYRSLTGEHSGLCDLICSGCMGEGQSSYFPQIIFSPGRHHGGVCKKW